MLTSYVLASRVRTSSGAVAAMIGGLGWCAASWHRDHGPATAVGLAGVYVGAFAVSHPVSRWVGAWPAVAAATAATGLSTHHVADRRSSTVDRSERPVARPDPA
jgi:ammonia channel protein AmtB